MKYETSFSWSGWGAGAYNPITVYIKPVLFHLSTWCASLQSMHGLLRQWPVLNAPQVPWGMVICESAAPTLKS